MCHIVSIKRLSKTALLVITQVNSNMPGVHWEMIRMFELATTIKNAGIRIISVSCDLDSYTAEHHTH